MDWYDCNESELLDLFTKPCPERVSKFQTQLNLPEINLTPEMYAQMLQLLPMADDHYEGTSTLSLSFLPL